MTSGSLVFSPIPDQENNALPGRPGVAEIAQDGSYSMKIEPGSDGLCKRFTVRFSPPPPPEWLNAETAEKYVPLYQGLVPRETKIEIKPGNNVADIELVSSSNN